MLWRVACCGTVATHRLTPDMGRSGDRPTTRGRPARSVVQISPVKVPLDSVFMLLLIWTCVTVHSNVNCETLFVTVDGISVFIPRMDANEHE